MFTSGILVCRFIVLIWLLVMQNYLLWCTVTNSHCQCVTIVLKLMKVKLTERFSWLFPTAQDSFCSSTWEKKLDNMKPDEVVSKIQAHEMLIFEGDGSLQPKILLSRLTPERRRGRGHPIFFQELKWRRRSIKCILTSTSEDFWLLVCRGCEFLVDVFSLGEQNCIFCV